MASLVMGIVFVRKASRTSRREGRQSRGVAVQQQKPEGQDEAAEIPVIILGPDRSVALAVRDCNVPVQSATAGGSAHASDAVRPMGTVHSGHSGFGMDQSASSGNRRGVLFVVT
jgi:hypothetical protein